MNWPVLRAQIWDQHRKELQVAALCEGALRKAEEALATLSRHGHHFSLSEGTTASTSFPKMVFHFEKGKREVRCQADLDELGEGWASHPFDAEILAGMREQDEGKGGVPRRKDLLALEDEGRGVDLDPDRKSRWIREFQERKRVENGGA